jgi:DNA modification methylase
MKVKISDINVGDRVRTDFSDVEGLAVSIQQHGLLHPIIIDKALNLVAGERRLRAHIALGMKEIEVKDLGELTEDERLEIEGDENLRRKDFTWQEDLKWKKRWYELRTRLEGAAIKGHHGGFGLQEAADIRGMSVSSFGQDLQLASAVEQNPDLSECKNKTAAWKKFCDLKEQALTKRLVEKVQERQKGEQQAAAASGLLLTHSPLLHGDFRVEMAKLEKESVDFVLCDPPYGKDIQLKVSSEDENEKETPFDDSVFNTLELIDALMRESFRVLAPDRVMLMFFDISLYDRLMKMGEQVGFNVCRTPIVWHKTGGTGQPTHYSHYNPSYELILHLQKGYRKINRGNFPNVITQERQPRDSKIHPTQKPLLLMKQLIELHTLAGEMVIDPCAGSAASLIAALKTDRRAWGCELNEDFFGKATLEINKVLEMRMRGSAPVEKKEGKPFSFADQEVDFKFMTPGTASWQDFWRHHPEQQEAMVGWMKQLRETGGVV